MRFTESEESIKSDLSGHRLAYRQEEVRAAFGLSSSTFARARKAGRSLARISADEFQPCASRHLARRVSHVSRDAWRTKK
jgi:hypothetical protein